MAPDGSPEKAREGVENNRARQNRRQGERRSIIGHTPWIFGVAVGHHIIIYIHHILSKPSLGLWWQDIRHCKHKKCHERTKYHPCRRQTIPLPHAPLWRKLRLRLLPCSFVYFTLPRRESYETVTNNSCNNVGTGYAVLLRRTCRSSHARGHPPR